MIPACNNGRLSFQKLGFQAYAIYMFPVVKGILRQGGYR